MAWDVATAKTEFNALQQCNLLSHDSNFSDSCLRY